MVEHGSEHEAGTGFGDLTSDVKVAPNPMTHAELNALNYIEQVYQYTRSFPKAEILEKRFPTFSLQQALRKHSFVNGLLNRGIDLPSVDHEYLSPEQIAAVTSVLNWADKRPRSAKLKELGISPTKWAGWMRSKKFKEYLTSISSSNFEEAVDHAHEGLMRAVDKGNTEAIKYYMELTGRYTASSAEVVNLKVVLSKLIEAIQRNVSDPITLRKIEQDFEAIMSGSHGPVQPELVLPAAGPNGNKLVESI